MLLKFNQVAMHCCRSPEEDVWRGVRTGEEKERRRREGEEKERRRREGEKERKV